MSKTRYVNITAVCMNTDAIASLRHQCIRPDVNSPTKRLTSLLLRLFGNTALSFLYVYFSENSWNCGDAA